MRGLLILVVALSACSPSTAKQAEDLAQRQKELQRLEDSIVTVMCGARNGTSRAHAFSDVVESPILIPEPGAEPNGDAVLDIASEIEEKGCPAAR